MVRLFRILPLVIVVIVVSACPVVDDGPPAGEGAVTLFPLDGDVWAFALDVRGDATNCAKVDVGPENDLDARVDATLDGATYAARVPLVEGANTIVARCTNADGDVVASTPRSYLVRLADRPTARATARIEGSEVVLDASASTASEASNAALASFVWSDGGVGDEVRVALPTTEGAHTFTVDVTDANGKTDRARALVLVKGGVARVPAADEPPTWIDGAVVYGAVPPLFGYAGLASLTERLDELVDLGVDIVWISPVNEASFGDFGFDVTNHFAINPELGTEDDLRALVDAAHERGLRVILDVVPNHTSNQHPYYVDAQENGDSSRYWTFHERDDNGDATFYFDWDYLLNLDYDNVEVERMMSEALSRWVRDFDVDGFRVDAAWGVLDRSPDYWPKLRDELRRIKPDVFLLGEAGARDARMFPVFDAGYDWTDDLGVWAWQAAFDAGPPYAAALRDAVEPVLDRTTLHFLDNNDTGVRFRAEYGDDVTRSARALSMFLPGLAGLYVGDEIGASFDPYEQYDPLEWDAADPALREEVRALTTARHAHVAFATPESALVQTDQADDVIAFTRGAEGSDAGQVLVLISFAATDLSVTVDGRPDPIALPAWDWLILE